ncbi:transmembrane 7 superfamily member 3-like [Scleropages formosus]|uniref:Transmembrane 7 superfamily member 3-like n=1 Tax=Scleropages formosus TaxID=113540 RepID=A0A8C9R7C4_SCLFO|nr:transmembrane 7 superfamily member 3-like [Scleropages formosus]
MAVSSSTVITLNASTVLLRWDVSSPLTVGLMVRLHALARPVTVSTAPGFPADASYTGTSAGLWVPLSPWDAHVSVYARAESAVNVSVSAASYSQQDPVPGACNLEFRMENDPNVHLNFTEYETVAQFAAANIGTSRGQTPPPCDVDQAAHSRWELTYDVYHYFLPEGDLRESTLFEALGEIYSVEALQQRATKVASLSSNAKTRLYGNAFHGLGVLHVVVVTDPVFNTSSLYVPASTYSCYFSSIDPPSCHTQGETFWLVFLTLLGVYGLLVCFTGHRFLEAEYFFFGFLVCSFLCVALVARFSGESIQLCLVYGAVAGWVGGGLCALCRWRFGTPVLLTFLAGVALGTLLAAVVMVTPLVNEGVMRSDVLYWTCVTAMALVLPTLLLTCTRALNMMASAVVGSYAAVQALGLYLHTAHPQIIVSALLRRAVSPLYQQAVLVLPFQTLDCLLTVLWGALVLFGLLSQWCLTRTRAPFPPCPYQRQVAGPPGPPDERSPLLGAGHR